MANEEIVKGYALDKETFIEVSKDELENVALESTRTIEIDDFVDSDEIDPRYLIRTARRLHRDAGEGDEEAIVQAAAEVSLGVTASTFGVFGKWWKLSPKG